MGRLRAVFCQYLPKVVLLCAVLFNPCYSAGAKEGSKHDLFPLLKGLEGKVSFWEKIFIQYNSYQAIIHDFNYPEIIYEVIDFDPNSLDGRIKARKIKAAQWKYSQILRAIHYKQFKPSQLNHKERTIYQKFLYIKGSRKFLWASQNVHCQWGIKDKFEEGLIRSGRYQSWMKKIFAEEGLPQELTYLPHVESSFNYKAYSRVGAAGIWQFVHSTGKLFLRIDPYIDERLDPLLSSRAAAKLLKKNYYYLGNWPLAITAYNHGLPGILRAVNRTGSSNLASIIARYQSPAFGYASKNFYAEFLAALRVAQDYRRYFGDLKIEPPLQYRTITLPDYLDIADIKRYFSLTDKEIGTYNPSLLLPVLESQVYIPKGFQLRVPINIGPDLNQLYARIPAQKRYNQPKSLTRYRVKKGDTLLSIAKNFKVSLKGLKEINGIGRSSFIRVGQTIRLPQSISPRVSETILAAATPPENLGRQMPEESNHPGPDKRRSKKKDNLKAEIKPIKPMPIKTITKKKGFNMGWVMVEPQETLEHFAGWCDIPVQKLRRLNGLRPRQPIKVNQRIKVIFSRVDIEDFRNRRFEYHKALQEKFLANHQVKKTVTHTLKEKENVWYLCQNVYQIPYWLVRKYNPDKDLARLDKGDKLVIPIIKSMD